MSKVNTVTGHKEERLNFGPGLEAVPKEVYKDYVEWCEDCHLRPLSKHEYYQELELQHPELKDRKRIGSRMVYVGV